MGENPRASRLFKRRGLPRFTGVVELIELTRRMRRPSDCEVGRGG